MAPSAEWHPRVRPPHRPEPASGVQTPLERSSAGGRARAHPASRRSARALTKVISAYPQAARGGDAVTRRDARVPPPGPACGWERPCPLHFVGRGAGSHETEELSV